MSFPFLLSAAEGRGREYVFFFIPYYPQDNGSNSWVILKGTGPVDDWVIHQADYE